MNTAPFPAHLPDERGVRSRDRILLYTRGMGLDPIDSVEMALETLQRTGPHPAIPEAMQTLHSLLCEKGLAHGLLDDNGERLSSAPPMKRKPMIAEFLDRNPWLTAFKKLGRKSSH